MKDELRLRLESFEIDAADAAFPFSARLARENGWSREFARHVTAEYKRFVWLAMRAGHPVTPSEQVDEAWHLHMIHTRSYWDEMCGEILGKPLHHGPTKGGTAEESKFEDWYSRTLESYRQHFGEEPPADIWPPLLERFAAAPPPRKVNPATHWVIPKRVVKYAAAGAAVPLVLAGCSHLAKAHGGNLFCFFGLFLVVALIAAMLKKGGGRGGCGGGGSCGGGGGCGSSGDSGDSGGSGHSGCGGSSGCGSSGCGGGCGGGGGGD